jgi:hypothetical protein
LAGGIPYDDIQPRLSPTLCPVHKDLHQGLERGSHWGLRQKRATSTETQKHPVQHLGPPRHMCSLVKDEHNATTVARESCDSLALPLPRRKRLTAFCSAYSAHRQFESATYKLLASIQTGKCLLGAQELEELAGKAEESRRVLKSGLTASPRSRV